MFYRNEKLALLIDGGNLHATSKELGFIIDFKLLLREFMKRGQLLRASYYTLLPQEDDYSSLRPLVDWLAYNGFTTVTKAAREHTDSAGRRRWKGSIDVEIAVDAMALAEHVDHIVLFSGDGCFRVLVEALQRKGVRVTTVSTTRSHSPMIADDLRRQADNFIEMDDLRDLIGRAPRESAQEKAETMDSA